jgi:hypothetical protein
MGLFRRSQLTVVAVVLTDCPNRRSDFDGLTLAVAVNRRLE